MSTFERATDAAPSSRRRVPVLLPSAFGVLLAADVVGGLLDMAAGRTTLATAWGPEASLCAPWPMIAFQAVTVLVVVRGGRRSSRIAATLLALACGVSVVSGFFDGQLGRSDLSGFELGYQVVLLVLTAVVGAVGLGAFRRGR